MFHDLPPWINATMFAAAAGVVWVAGARLAREAESIAHKTGLGRELLGLVLLGGVTSLPELAVGVSATLSGTPELSVNDVLGSAAINVVMLALADAAYGHRALTSAPATPEVMLQGALGIVLLAFVVGATVTGDVLVAGIGAWSWLMLAGWVAALWVVSKSQGLQSWRPDRRTLPPHPREPLGNGDERTLRRVALHAAMAGAAILAAGFLLARTADALAGQTGLGTGFFGAVLLGLSTSLPEASTVFAALRLGRHEMALAGVLGTNLFNVSIIVLVDALHPGGPVLLKAGPFAAFGALLAIILTAVFLVGMIERRDRTVLRMGLDSLTVLAAYAAGVAVMYGLR